MSASIVDSEASLSKEQIEKVEQSLGIKLPEPYKAFLLKHNGGGPRPSGFFYRREGEDLQEGIISWFLAIHCSERTFDFPRGCSAHARVDTGAGNHPLEFGRLAASSHSRAALTVAR